jgi:hypothetical protein
LQVVVFLTAGREGKRRRKQGRSARFRHQQRRVKPRAASVPAWISAVPEALPLLFLEFWGLFCKVWIIWCNFFFWYYNLYCGYKKKRKKKKKEEKRKRKKREKHIVKKHMCVFECFFYGYIFCYVETAKHKEGFNILIGSRCRSINLYESCISKFRWKDKIFKTSLTHHSHEAAYLR